MVQRVQNEKLIVGKLMPQIENPFIFGRHRKTINFLFWSNVKLMILGVQNGKVMVFRCPNTDGKMAIVTLTIFHINVLRPQKRCSMSYLGLLQNFHLLTMS